MDGCELGAYLEKFERIMRESEIEVNCWAERLYPRLPERLCVRVAQLRDVRIFRGEGCFIEGSGRNCH